MQKLVTQQHVKRGVLKMNIGKVLKKERNNNGVLANYVCSKLGITRQYLSVIESGRIMPSARIVSKYLNLIGSKNDLNSLQRKIKNDLFDKWATKNVR
jgi:transcriptional regulator with XRE-family HTH domain